MTADAVIRLLVLVTLLALLLIDRVGVFLPNPSSGGVLGSDISG